MKHILLINPPIADFYQTAIRQQPLGLEYIAAILTEKGYTVHQVDALNTKSKYHLPLPHRLEYLKKFYPAHDLSPFKLFTQYQHFGLSFEEIRSRLKLITPDVIGITANFTSYFNNALTTAKICKQLFPKVPVVMGGHHVTVLPHSALTSGYVDFVILGEGEFVFLELIKILNTKDTTKLANLHGLVFKKETGIQINPPQHYIENLDALPFPNASQNFSRYKMMITSRGCPRGCTFCSIEKVMGKKVRKRSISSIVAEIRQAIAHGVTCIDFEDDNLTFNFTHASTLFKFLIDNFKGQQIRFSAMNGLEVETLNETLIALMKQAGFEWLNIPLVSGNIEVRKQIYRHQSNEKFLSIIKLAQLYQLKVVAYIILGLPEDKLQHMLDDIIFLAGQKLLIGPSVFYPPPGTPIYDLCLAKGYIQPDNFEQLRSSAIPVQTEKFSRTDIVTLFRFVRVINFIKKIIDQNLNHDEHLLPYLHQFKLGDNSLIFNHKLTSDEIGMLLLQQLFINGELKGLTRKTGSETLYQYQWIDYHHSPSLVTAFLQSLNGKRFVGVETAHAFLL